MKGPCCLLGCRRVFLFTAVNTFLRLLYFRFGRDYLEYLDAHDESTQIQLANDKTKDTFIRMQASAWFNIAKADGRRGALCQMLALVKWYKASKGDGGDEDDDVEEEEDDDDYEGGDGDEDEDVKMGP